MKKASVSSAKNELSALIDAVKQGEEVLIFDRERPVARLVPVQGRHAADARLLELERSGGVRRGSAKRLRLKPVRLPPDVSVVAALLDEREQGR